MSCSLLLLEVLAAPTTTIAAPSKGLHDREMPGSHRKLEIYDFLSAERDALAAQPALAEPLLRGADLIELGVAPGPRLGQLLNELRDRQLAEEITTREAALVWAKENAAKSGSTD